MGQVVFSPCSRPTQLFALSSIFVDTETYHTQIILTDVRYLVSSIWRWYCIFSISTIPYSITSYTTTYHKIPYHTTPYHKTPHNTIQYNTIPYHTIPFIPYHTMPSHYITSHTTPYYTIQHHTKWYQTILYLIWHFRMKFLRHQTSINSAFSRLNRCAEMFSIVSTGII